MTTPVGAGQIATGLGVSLAPTPIPGLVGTLGSGVAGGLVALAQGVIRGEDAGDVATAVGANLAGGVVGSLAAAPFAALPGLLGTAAGGIFGAAAAIPITTAILDAANDPNQDKRLRREIGGIGDAIEFGRLDPLVGTAAALQTLSRVFVDENTARSFRRVVNAVRERGVDTDQLFSDLGLDPVPLTRLARSGGGPLSPVAATSTPFSVPAVQRLLDQVTDEAFFERRFRVSGIIGGTRLVDEAELAVLQSDKSRRFGNRPVIEAEFVTAKRGASPARSFSSSLADARIVGRITDVVNGQPLFNFAFRDDAGNLLSEIRNVGTPLEVDALLNAPTILGLAIEAGSVDRDQLIGLEFDVGGFDPRVSNVSFNPSSNVRRAGVSATVITDVGTLAGVTQRGVVDVRPFDSVGSGGGGGPGPTDPGVTPPAPAPTAPPRATPAPEPSPAPVAPAPPAPGPGSGDVPVVFAPAPPPAPSDPMSPVLPTAPTPGGVPVSFQDFFGSIGGAITSGISDAIPGLANVGVDLLRRELGVGGAPVVPINARGAMPMQTNLFGNALPVAQPAFFDVPGVDLVPQGAGSITSPFVPTRGGARAQPFIATNPATGRTTWFKPAGRPVLWSGDLAAAKRVRKVAARARRSGGR